MFHGQELILHLTGDLVGTGQGAIHVTGDVDLVRLPAGAAHSGHPLQLRLDGGFQAGGVRPHAGDQLGDEAALLIQQGVEQVSLLNLGVAIFTGEHLSGLDGFLGFLGEVFLVHIKTSSSE